jgi:hypothetical protein
VEAAEERESKKERDVSLMRDLLYDQLRRRRDNPRYRELTCKTQINRPFRVQIFEVGKSVETRLSEDANEKEIAKSIEYL